MTATRQPSLLSRIVWKGLNGLYRMRDFRLEGGPPDLPKFIIVGAPHTTNWDFIFFAGVVQEMGIKPNFIGKHTLFKWPMTDFMRDMGGMPVDRSKPGGYVQAVVRWIAEADSIALVIAPEGSRSSDGRWRTGFWHIANEAQIPLVPAWVNHESRRGGMGAPIMPSGDFHADLAKIAAFYREHRPDSPRTAMLEAQARGEVEAPGRKRD